MKVQQLPFRWPAAVAVMMVVVLAGAGFSHRLWLPRVRELLLSTPGTSGEEHGVQVGPHGGHAHEGHDHGSHEHDHPGHVDEEAIRFSAAGLKNVDYQPMTVALSSFVRSITLPAMVVERPGHSQIYITAPLTGVVTRIYPVEGAAVEPGNPMFEVRLTHEDLVAAQRSFLQTLENLDVVQREIDRLKTAGEGVVAGRRIIEQEYEQQKLQAALRAERQALLLHGLAGEQIDGIQKERHLVQSLTVFAPDHIDEAEACSEEHLFHVQKLPVKLGEQVESGHLLCVLADHCELYIEGRAFEDDAERLREVLREGRSIQARVLAGRRQTDVIEGLKLLYLADQVDIETRAFRFYLRLPNQIALNQVTENGRHFIAWRFNPGQRMELSIPVEIWQDRIVLPVSAVVEEGAEAFVFERNGDHFDRVAVHVEYRDQTSVIIARDDALRPGDVIAAQGAYQMHLALKNRTGGGADPHAGHSH